MLNSDGTVLLCILTRCVCGQVSVLVVGLVWPGPGSSCSLQRVACPALEMYLFKQVERCVGWVYQWVKICSLSCLYASVYTTRLTDVNLSMAKASIRSV